VVMREHCKWCGEELDIYSNNKQYEELDDGEELIILKTGSGKNIDEYYCCADCFVSDYTFDSEQTIFNNFVEKNQDEGDQEDDIFRTTKGASGKEWLVEQVEDDTYVVYEEGEKDDPNLVSLSGEAHCDGTYFKYNDSCPHVQAAQEFEKHQDEQKSFDHHQGTALSRQDIAKQALLDAGYNNFVEFESDEYDDNMELDVRGIDAKVDDEDGKLNFVALKTRSTYKRDNPDISLRVAGRKGGRSLEWERFVSDSEPVPDILVFCIMHDKINKAEVFVIDFSLLKEMYKTGPMRKLLYKDVGVVRKYDGPVESNFYHAEIDQDNGLFAFLDISDIVGTECIIHSESYEM